jgi:hypothetical protein
MRTEDGHGPPAATSGSYHFRSVGNFQIPDPTAADFISHHRKKGKISGVRKIPDFGWRGRYGAELCLYFSERASAPPVSS